MEASAIKRSQGTGKLNDATLPIYLISIKLNDKKNGAKSVYLTCPIKGK
jgi:hypothetical protein